ncbi:hypothetical protein Tco_0801243 [Tanacetum coccineum]|uniref:Uncharacterized protein n=1 Tax=Tanacetum coccineum TaxID=301880 RepID=A0ABQ4ZVF0_9ASTR
MEAINLGINKHECRETVKADIEKGFDKTHDYILEDEFSMRLEEERKGKEGDIWQEQKVVDKKWRLWAESSERRFWESLVCLDPTRKGWLMDEHIDLWVDYMWHVRPHDAKWAMVSSYFVQLLLQNGMPLWYVNGESYSIALTKANKGRLLEVLELVNVFNKKGIDKSTYCVTFRIAENMPKQRVYLVTVGCGYVFFCIVYIRPLELDVEDPL